MLSMRMTDKFDSRLLNDADKEQQRVEPQEKKNALIAREKKAERDAVHPKLWTQYYGLQNGSASGEQTLQFNSLSSQHGSLHIRSKESPNKPSRTVENQPPSLLASAARKASKHVIDLTEDDDDAHNKEPVAPRKKSRSSSGSSDASLKIVKHQPIRATSHANKDQSAATGYNKRRAVSPPAYPFESLPTSRKSSVGQQPLRSPDVEQAYEAIRRQSLLEQSSHKCRAPLPSARPTLQEQSPHEPRAGVSSARLTSQNQAFHEPAFPVPPPHFSVHHTPSQPPSPQPSVHSPKSQPSRHVTSQQPSHQPPLQPISRSLRNPRQYASAVVVRSSSEPTEPTPEEIEQRQCFLRNLSQVPQITLTNNFDNTSPPTSFQFIPASILRPGVYRAPDDVLVGCSCRKKRGSNECKYPNECNCLADSAGDSVRKRSQYHEGNKRGCLVPHFLKSRFNIYECNSRCDCSDQCKNRVVQWGRQVGLEIFKTSNGRGWGLRCGQNLQEGQFVDTYRGEIITTEEADKRKKGANEDNYLFDFDKFEEAKYVCDGMHMGGPTRFMNHSCRPNCALFTVTYNHNDTNLYELAFFAMQYIPKGTELTFDYVDRDDIGKITEEDARKMESEKGYAPSVCRCGSDNCRGYFFFTKETE